MNQLKDLFCSFFSLNFFFSSFFASCEEIHLRSTSDACFKDIPSHRNRLLHYCVCECCSTATTPVVPHLDTRHQSKPYATQAKGMRSAFESLGADFSISSSKCWERESRRSSHVNINSILSVSWYRRTKSRISVNVWSTVFRLGKDIILQFKHIEGNKRRSGARISATIIPLNSIQSDLRRLEGGFKRYSWILFPRIPESRIMFPKTDARHSSSSHASLFVSRENQGPDIRIQNSQWHL